MNRTGSEKGTNRIRHRLIRMDSTLRTAVLPPSLHLSHSHEPERQARGRERSRSLTLLGNIPSLPPFLLVDGPGCY